MKVISLTPPLLNYWVGKSMGLDPQLDGRGPVAFSVVSKISGALEPYQPATDWAQAGPLLATEWYEIESMMIEWLSPRWSFTKDFLDAPLLWLMRALVADRFGDEVEDYFPGKREP